MSIYTKTGDKGTTALFDGNRVKKYDDRVETYGSFDELNAEISVAEKFVTSAENKTLLRNVERQLFYVCAELATEHEASSLAKLLLQKTTSINLKKSLMIILQSCQKSIVLFFLDQAQQEHFFIAQGLLLGVVSDY